MTDKSDLCSHPCLLKVYEQDSLVKEEQSTEALLISQGETEWNRGGPKTVWVWKCDGTIPPIQLHTNTHTLAGLQNTYIHTIPCWEIWFMCTLTQTVKVSSMSVYCVPLLLDVLQCGCYKAGWITYNLFAPIQAMRSNVKHNQSTADRQRECNCSYYKHGVRKVAEEDEGEDSG